MRDHLLPQPLVRDAHHGGEGDLLVGQQHLLDLARVHVVAAAHDHVLGAVDDPVEALRIAASEVAGAEPAVPQHRGGLLGAAQVTGHDVVAAHDDLPDLVDLAHAGPVGVGGVDQVHLHAPHRQADRSGARALAAGEGGDRGGLGEPVALHDRDPEMLLHAAQDLDRQRGAARDAQAQMLGEPLGRGAAGEQAQQRPPHGGHAREDAHAVAQQQLEGLLRFEAGQQHEGRPHREAGVHVHRRPEGVEQRQDDQVGILPRPRVEQPVAGQSVHELVGVAELGALGPPGGARGVEDHGSVGLGALHGGEGSGPLGDGAGEGGHPLKGALGRRVRGDQHDLRRTRRGRGALDHVAADGQLLGALEAEGDRGVGVVEVVGDLAGLVQHVQRDDHRAGLEDPEVDDRELRQVGAAQRHPVPRLDPEFDQEMRDAAGGGVDLGVGQGGLAQHQGGTVGGGAGAVLEHHGEVEHAAVSFVDVAVTGASQYDAPPPLRAHSPSGAPHRPFRQLRE